MKLSTTFAAASAACALLVSDPARADGTAAPAAPAPASVPGPNAGESVPARTANNSIFVELLGNGGIYSVNYERLFGDSNFSLRVGFSYFSVSASGDGSSSRASLVTVPLVGSYYLGGENHKLQLGIGLVAADVSASTSSSGTGYLSGSGFGVGGTAVVGYRYIPASGGFNFGVGFTPIFGGGGFLPYPGISFGGGF